MSYVAAGALMRSSRGKHSHDISPVKGRLGVNMPPGKFWLLYAAVGLSQHQLSLHSTICTSHSLVRTFSCLC